MDPCDDPCNDRISKLSAKKATKVDNGAEVAFVLIA